MSSPELPRASSTRPSSSPRPWLRDLVAELGREPAGIAGIIMLALFLAGAVFEKRLIVFPQTNSRWHDITYWDEQPANAPPVWTNVFARQKSAVSLVLTPIKTSEETSDSARLETRIFSYSYDYDLPPRDLVIHFHAAGDIPVAITLTRPDGQEITLDQEQVAAGTGTDVRISVERSAGDAVMGFLQGNESQDALAGVDVDRIHPASVLFSKAGPGMLSQPQPLKGNYQVTLLTVLTSSAAKVSIPSLVITGRVSGLLGTDGSKRDLWSGVVAGIKWALLIGLLTAFVSVAIGVVWGVTAAYFGGPINWLMQRVFEIFSNQPLLPLLIVISAVFKPSIWFLIVIMSVFFWTGPVKTVYAMALSIREETYIEASRALGAGSARLIFRHMVPLLIPYAFASMALSVPGAVVYESTVSLLGLGDASIVTWGQILHDAFTGGAVLAGLWWWVVPPGLMIALMGMTFSFIGFAMDRILHPKLRTR
ncbi:MAG: ABC transporter permease [Spirochaetia bacterium]|jgi:peptide/nickel transport system permease protein